MMTSPSPSQPCGLGPSLSRVRERGFTPGLPKRNPLPPLGGEGRVRGAASQAGHG